MANKEIVDYLVEGKKRGFSFNLLKKKLLEARFEEKDIDEAIKEAETKEKDSTPIADDKVLGSDKKILDKKVEFGKEGRILKAEVMSSWRKIGKSIVHPVELFEKTKGEGVGAVLKYLYVASIIPFFVACVLSIIFMKEISSVLIERFGPFFETLNVVRMMSSISLNSAMIVVGFYIALFFVIIPILSFIVSGIIHFVTMVYGGLGEFSETYGAVVYGASPSLLFLPVLFVNIGTIVWSFILHIFGISKKQNISKLRAFFVLITPFLVAGFIVVVVWLMQKFLVE